MIYIMLFFLGEKKEQSEKVKKHPMNTGKEQRV